MVVACPKVKIRINLILKLKKKYNAGLPEFTGREFLDFLGSFCINIFLKEFTELIYFISWTFLYFIIYCASVRPHGYSQKGDQSSAIVRPGDVTTITYLLYCLLTSNYYYTSSQKFFDKCEHIISNAIFFSVVG